MGRRLVQEQAQSNATRRPRPLKVLSSLSTILECPAIIKLFVSITDLHPFEPLPDHDIVSAAHPIVDCLRLTAEKIADGELFCRGLAVGIDPRSSMFGERVVVVPRAGDTGPAEPEVSPMKPPPTSRGHDEGWGRWMNPIGAIYQH